ncbi:MAG: hypothetical protein RBS07_01990 [Lentimicrobium sp.]|jgi:hypothetical protein|nr:hypothetical protein [Lentimicrobium sp.]
MKLIRLSTNKRESQLTLVMLAIVIVVLRIMTLKSNELSWDVLGYYIHLPALFIYNDYGLSDLSWIQQLMSQYSLTDSLYQISTGPDGNPIFFFLMGMSFFYLPWFLIGHLLASFSGYPVDGFSLPYQYSLAIGVIVYTVIGLIYLRKVLLEFFSDRITTITLIIIVLGTNYLHFMTVKNLETANILFMMVALITWNTIQWHKTYKLKNLIALGIFTVLTALSKPSEVLIFLLPVFWGIYNKETFYNRFRLFWKKRNQVIIAILASIVVALPQIIYWYTETGNILYDSYKNPGVGLDLASPHILNVLFSFKKGWFIYTPVMIFSVMGFVQLYRKNKPVFTPVLIYCLIAFYLLASWTEWWYGASFSIRPMITLYPLLAIALGYFLQTIKDKNFAIKTGVYLLIVFFTLLNLFQTWQINNFILEPYRMTQKYYFAIFGKTHITEKDRQYLAPDLTFNADAKLTNESAFNRRNIGYYDFEEADVNLKNFYITDSLGNTVLMMDSTLRFSPEIKNTFRGLTSRDYFWVRASADVFIPKGYKEELPLLVMTFERKGGAYSYHSYGVDTSIYKPGTWGKISVDLMSPNVRSSSDYFKIYFWHRGNQPVLIDNIKADVFEPK